MDQVWSRPDPSGEEEKGIFVHISYRGQMNSLGSSLFVICVREIPTCQERLRHFQQVSSFYFEKPGAQSNVSQSVGPTLPGIYIKYADL